MRRGFPRNRTVCKLGPGVSELLEGAPASRAAIDEYIPYLPVLSAAIGKPLIQLGGRCNVDWLHQLNDAEYGE